MESNCMEFRSTMVLLSVPIFSFYALLVKIFFNNIVFILLVCVVSDKPNKVWKQTTMATTKF